MGIGADASASVKGLQPGKADLCGRTQGHRRGATSGEKSNGQCAMKGGSQGPGCQGLLRHRVS